MKVVIFTSNGIRHKYVANTLAKFVDDILIVSESRQNDASDKGTETNLSPINEHFRKRYFWICKYIIDLIIQYLCSFTFFYHQK